VKFSRIACLALFICATSISAALASIPTVTKTWSWNVATTTAGLSMSATMGDKTFQSYFLLGSDTTPIAMRTNQAGSGGIQSHAELTGLKPGTKYTYTAVAKNADGTTQMTGSFTTDPGAVPLLTPLPVAKDITYNGAVIAVGLSSVIDGNITFGISPQPSLAGEGSFILPGIGFGRGDSVKNIDLSGRLQPNTKYYYQVQARTVYGLALHNVQSFTTAKGGAAAPTISRLGSSNKAIIASFSTTLNNYGQPAQIFFQYGTAANLAAAKLTPVQSLLAAATPVDAGASVGDLLPGTTYYYRAVVSTSVGAVNSAIQSFTTLAPVITRVWSWNEASTTAGLSMSVTPNGMAQNVHFAYGTSATLAGASTTTPRSMNLMDGGIQSHAELGGLTPNTTYYYQAVLVNSAGSVKSPIQTFKTKA
jgi:phosphodiesterase/alkaline phosphatase D-like protein